MPSSRWKVTVINMLFALALLIGRYGFGKNLIKQMLAKGSKPDRVTWDNVNLSAGSASSPCAGLLSLYVAFTSPRRCGSTSRCSACWA